MKLERRQTPASLARRAAGSSIDGLPLLILLGTLVAAMRRPERMKISKWVGVTVQGLNVLGTAWLVAVRGATPGQQLLGLRVVDAATGDNLPFARALLRTAPLYAGSTFWIVAGGSRFDTTQHRRDLVEERQTTLQRKISQLEDQYANDPKGLSAAINAVYRDHSGGFNPWTGCLDPKLIVSMISILAAYGPAFWSPRRQALHDRFGRAAVIRTK